MKVFWALKEDDREECPRCGSTLMTFDGVHALCAPCAAREIKRLRMEVKRLTQRAPDLGQAVANPGDDDVAPSV